MSLKKSIQIKYKQQAIELVNTKISNTSCYALRVNVVRELIGERDATILKDAHGVLGNSWLS